MAYHDGFMVIESKKYTDSEWANEALCSPEVGDYGQDIWQEVYVEDVPEITDIHQLEDPYYD